MVILRVENTLSAVVEQERSGFIHDVCIMVKAPDLDVALVWYDETHSKEVKEGMTFVSSFLRFRDIPSFTVIADPPHSADELLQVGRKQYNDFLTAAGVKK